MIPRKLMLRNFMCYREDVPPLVLDGINIACLSGENGAGKSALLDAITWALWGEARLKSDDDLIALGAQEMEVEMIFMLDGQDYRVIRKRNKGKRGQSWLDFQVQHNGGWRPLSGATLRETQQIITSTLHMGYETFTNSAFLRQGHADEFTRKEPGRRKQVLADILGLDVYENLEGSARERAKKLDGQIKVLEGQMVELEQQAEQQTYHQQAVAAMEARVEHLTEQATGAEQDLAEATERVQFLEQLRRERDAHRLRMTQLRAERDELARAVAELRQNIAEEQQILARRAEIEAGMAAFHAAQAEIERLEGLRGDYDRLIEQQRGHADALREAERRIRTDLRLAEGELKGLRERAARRPQIEAGIAELGTRLKAFASLANDLANVRAQRADLQERNRTVGELRVQQSELKSQIAIKHDSLVGSREELKRRLKDAAARLKNASQWEADLARLGNDRARLEADNLRLQELRRIEREQAEQVGALRAACDSIKAQGDDINKKLSMLTEDAHDCPLCGNDLGDDGMAHIEQEYERQRKALRAQYSTSRREADAIEAELNDMRAEIKELEQITAALPSMAGRIARLESDLSVVADLRKQQAEDQRVAAEIDLQIVRGDYEHGVRAELARVEAAMGALGDQKTLSREIDRVEASMRRLEDRIAEQAQLEATVEAHRRDLAALDAEAEVLQAQEQHVAEFYRVIAQEDWGHAERAALQKIDAQIAALGYTPERYTAARLEVRELQGWADEQRLIERAEASIARDEQALGRDEQALQRRDDDLAQSNEQLVAMERDLQALGPAIHRRDEATAVLQRCRRELAVAQRDLGERQALLRRSEEAATKLAASRRERDALGKRKSLFDELVTAFGKKGVQAMLIETAIPEIEREANVLLARMTDNQMHLTFETQRDTKKGDVSETLDIKIADALGTRDYNAYSGGESFRVDFAIRIALAKLLARRAGARLETLVIDEGFGSQDTRGRERLVEAITSVQRDFKQILVVTHIQELKEMFPIHIEIGKTAQGSRWAIG
jgi:exonuclease SbcC